MYKLFLCLTYLHRRVMAYFAMLAVALCVTMLIIAISVMDGFLRQIEVAAKGLFGDIVINAPGQGGLSHYDEFIAEVKKLEEVEAATPFIMAYGILRIPKTSHSQPVQIAGIRLPERAGATSFEEGLFVQAGDWMFDPPLFSELIIRMLEEGLPVLYLRRNTNPTFDPPIEDIITRLGEEADADAEIFLREEKRLKALRKRMGDASGRSERVLSAQIDAKRALLRHLDRASFRRSNVLTTLRKAQPFQATLRKIQKQIDEIIPHGADGAALSPELVEKRDALRDELYAIEKKAQVRGPRNHIILGLGMSGLSYRTEDRETIRVVGPGERIVLSIFPLGQRLSVDTAPVDAAFTVVDDSKSGVLMFDQNTVYVPFEELQLLSKMGAEVAANDPSEVVVHPRCGQIHIKLGEKYAEGKELAIARDRVEQAWLTFCKTHPKAGGQDVTVRTWREQQASTIGPIESQRTLVVIMFGVMSLVSVVLIFVIFYTIVVQHTRDIGVIKSLGGSGLGVAGIFLAYGSIIGAIGAAAGVVGGAYFVHYINEIHNWMGETYGFRVWSAEVFMFDSIPNTIEVGTTIMIVLLAIVGGLIGALLPAIRAARMQPVEALRYE